MGRRIYIKRCPVEKAIRDHAAKICYNYRDEHRLTQKELSELTGIKPTYISHIENSSIYTPGAIVRKMIEFIEPSDTAGGDIL